MHSIKRGIFYEDAYTGVTLGALVSSHGVIMIDAPLRPEDARSWRAALLNQRGGTQRILFALDAHPDRALGARAMDCTLVTHQHTAQVFRSRPSIFKGDQNEAGAQWEVYDEVIGTRWAVPDLTFTDRLSLFWSGPEVVAEHHPGPMPGACWVAIIGEKVVFVGDAVVIDQPPFLAHADLPAWVKSLQVLLDQYADYTIISGRGGPLTPAIIATQMAMLNTIIQQVDRLVAQKAPAEAAQDIASDLLASFDLTTENAELYKQRLQFGLQQYYIRRLHPQSVVEPVAAEEIEASPNTLGS